MDTILKEKKETENDKKEVKSILPKEIQEILRKDTNLRRKMTIEKILENKGKSVSRALKESGYAVNYAKNPKFFLNAKKTKALLGWIDYELQQIALRMDKTRNKAKYKELSDTFVNMKKLSQLIGGNPTERIELAPAQKEEIDNLFEENVL